MSRIFIFNGISQNIFMRLISLGLLVLCLLFRSFEEEKTALLKSDKSSNLQKFPCLVTNGCARVLPLILISMLPFSYKLCLRLQSMSSIVAIIAISPLWFINHEFRRTYWARKSVTYHNPVLSGVYIAMF